MEIILYNFFRIMIKKKTITQLFKNTKKKVYNHYKF